MKAAPVRVFISYSHRDERFLKVLETHLSMLKRQRVIDLWHDHVIGPGHDVHDAIDSRLEESTLILLLVSPDFMASEYCYAKEMTHAMQKHHSGEARVIPIILRPVDWASAPFSGLKALPKDGRAVSTWKTRDTAYLDIARGIREAASDTLNRKSGGSHDTLKALAFNGYAASVVQVGGIGSRLVTKTAWLTTEHGYLDADAYVAHFFNGGGDILWVSCPDGFRIADATSPTDNSVFPMDKDEPDSPYGILLENKIQNTIVIRCERTLPEGIDPPRATGTLCRNCGQPMGPFEQNCPHCNFPVR